MTLGDSYIVSVCVCVQEMKVFTEVLWLLCKRPAQRTPKKKKEHHTGGKQSGLSTPSWVRGAVTSSPSRRWVMRKSRVTTV